MNNLICCSLSSHSTKHLLRRKKKQIYLLLLSLLLGNFQQITYNIFPVLPSQFFILTRYKNKRANLQDPTYIFILFSYQKQQSKKFTSSG